MTTSLVQGFTAAYRDPVTGSYPLGHGYRIYSPGGVMRFMAQDDFSPFGTGGANAYAYGAGNPINGMDPTGHDFWDDFAKDLFLTANTFIKFFSPQVNMITTAMGMPSPPTWDHQQWSMPSAKEQLVARITLDVEIAVIGVALAVVTLGVGLAIVSSVLAVVSGALSIASDVETYKGNTGAAQTLNYAAMGVGVFDAVFTGVGEAGLTIARMEARTISGVVKVGLRAAMGQTVGLGINAALYFGLPPLLKALIGSPPEQVPPSQGRLTITDDSLPSGFDIYPSGFDYPVAAGATIIPAYSAQEPALPLFGPALPAVHPGYPAQYAALWR